MRQDLLNQLHQTPESAGQSDTRWRLASLRAACPWLKLTTDGSLSRLLQRLGIRRKRAREYLHSPDPTYTDKVAYLEACWQAVEAAPERQVLLYLDEFGFSRQPSLSVAYEQRGHVQPLARRSYRRNQLCRGLGALNRQTGQLSYIQASHISASVLTAFYRQLTQTYPEAEVIYVVQDNWPVHLHPRVLAALQPQQFPFQPWVPAHWAQGKALAPPLPIQLVFLPTYAPWLNPIEKLWRLVRQKVIHLHRFSNDWAGLQQRVLDFMARYAAPSPALLHTVGLLPS